MSFSEKYRKVKVVAGNLNRAFGAVGTQMAGGVLSNPKKAVYKPVRYVKARTKALKPGVLGTGGYLVSGVNTVASGLGKLSKAHNDVGFSGTPQLRKGQEAFFFGKSGSGGKASTEYYGKGMKEVKYQPAGLKNPHFKYNKI